MKLGNCSLVSCFSKSTTHGLYRTVEFVSHCCREMNIRVERKRHQSGDYFENIGGMLFKDGFLYKTVAMKSISTMNVQPSFDELEKFRQPGEGGDGDMASLSTLFANRKKGHFMKGDRVIVVKGDLKNLKGCVEKVEENTVHIRPSVKELQVDSIPLL